MTDVWIITGKQNSGKTVMLMNVMKVMQEKGISICGIISPGIYKNGERTAIQVLNIDSGENMILADLKPGWDLKNPIKKWKILEGTIDWGNEQLRRMDANGKIFFLDEIGIFELVDKKGWQAGLKILEEKTYIHAVINVRKDVFSEMIKICEKANISFEMIDMDVLSKPKHEIIQEICTELLK
ncbi:MAG: nucleoside-triphosphatase [Anaerolineaceae bacterium]